MPNWTENTVRIDAPIDAVKSRLLHETDNGRDEYYFNMHKLFAERFAADDLTGSMDWEYDWAVHQTGSKWFPVIQAIEEREGSTRLTYDTARAPNNSTLERLFDLTRWTIENEYEEPGMGFEGIFTCDAYGIRDVDRAYRPLCEICNRKREIEHYSLDDEKCICDDCRKDGPKVVE